MDVALTIIADVVILVTFPLQCRYLQVMTSKTAQLSVLEYAFRATLTSIVVANLLYSTIFILVQEPAAYGLFPDFFQANSWWIGKIAIMQAVPLALATAIFHLVIALNRFSALVFPIRHNEFWSETNTSRILAVIWTFTVIECLPLVYPFSGTHYVFLSPLRTVGIGLGVADDLANVIYQVIVTAVGGCMELLVIVIYAAIGVRLSRMKACYVLVRQLVTHISRQNLPQSYMTTTVSALLVSTGGVLVLLVILPDILATRIGGKSLWSQEMFYALFKFANSYNNAVTPWVMFFYYSKVRRLLLSREPNAKLHTVSSLLHRTRITSSR